ncbi:SDR family oxidoreductase [Yinghuangia seranimata]|uniref:SDR family oxidoreductase n=1 Tax=Yinghuangia seranimata TaxID=408067 RepID=UPI00248AF783|nr:NmrA family transcriptional regulator [Yinghuangia seranimata]MDI2132040.1 NmrA family transcriptional regulator [Yinghuangia seranimata]
MSNSVETTAATTSNDTVLVTGGTGKTGRRVAELLAARGVPTRIGSRSAEIPFDWNDRSTWKPVVQGVRAAYLAYYPDLAVPGAAETVGAFAKLAAEEGVERLVVLSGRGEPEAQQAEQLVMAAGAQWTVVRAAWFFQNFSENFMVDPVIQGEVALPVDGVLEPFVDADDIAEVAAVALTEDGHHGEIYEVTGPRMLTFAEAIGEIAAAAGRPVEFVPVPMDAYAQVLTELGEPDEVVWLIRYLFTEVLDGRNSHLTDGVKRALGREPRDFTEYARSVAATGLWNAPAE